MSLRKLLLFLFGCMTVIGNLKLKYQNAKLMIRILNSI